VNRSCRRCGLSVQPGESFHHRGRAVVHQRCPYQVQADDQAALSVSDILHGTSTLTMEEIKKAFEAMSAAFGSRTTYHTLAADMPASWAASADGGIRVKRRKGPVARAQERAHAARLRDVLSPECCDEPSPRIAARSGRMYCANCETYLISIDHSALAGGTIEDLPPHEDSDA
jgi:hypothetical protein